MSILFSLLWLVWVCCFHCCSWYKHTVFIAAVGMSILFCIAVFGTSILFSLLCLAWVYCFHCCRPRSCFCRACRLNRMAICTKVRTCQHPPNGREKWWSWLQYTVNGYVDDQKITNYTTCFVCSYIFSVSLCCVCMDVYIYRHTHASVQYTQYIHINL